jgi:manganese transport system ATP-binding protein
MGAVRPTSGAIRILGLESSSARASNLVGYVPQSDDVDWTFPISVAEVVMMGRYGRQGPRRVPSADDRAAVVDALRRVELTELADRQIGKLSGGQRRRAFVARCLAQDAAVLLLDEPFSGIDKRSEATVSGVLRDLAASGRTVLVSTHDLRSLPDLCDEVLLLHRRILVHGTPEEVLQPDNLALAFGLDPGAPDGRDGSRR